MVGPALLTGTARRVWRVPSAEVRSLRGPSPGAEKEVAQASDRLRPDAGNAGQIVDLIEGAMGPPRRHDATGQGRADAREKTEVFLRRSVDVDALSPPKGARGRALPGRLSGRRGVRPGSTEPTVRRGNSLGCGGRRLPRCGGAAGFPGCALFWRLRPPGRARQRDQRQAHEDTARRGERCRAAFHGPFSAGHRRGCGTRAPPVSRGDRALVTGVRPTASRGRSRREGSARPRRPSRRESNTIHESRSC